MYTYKNIEYVHNKHTKSIKKNSQMPPNRWNVHLFYEQVYEKTYKNGKKSYLSSLVVKAV